MKNIDSITYDLKHSSNSPINENYEPEIDNFADFKNEFIEWYRFAHPNCNTTPFRNQLDKFCEKINKV